jgi:hypothetical protein
MLRSTPSSLPSRKPRLARVAVIVLAVALLHLLLLQWASGRIGLPSLPEPEEKVITTALLAPPADTPLVPKPAVKPRPPKPTPRRRPPRAATAPTPPPELAATPEPAPAPDPEPVAQAAAEPSLAGMEAPGTSVETPAATATPEPAASAKEASSNAYKIDPPPSAELQYDVQSLQKGQTYYGSGKIDWQASGNSYRIDGEAGVLFFTVLSFRSEGTIDEFGVSPIIYSEKRIRRSETATHFHRERNTISFSASTLSYPRKGGEQDRASIVWQLAGIGRGDSEKFTPGTELDVMVAGVRDAETWRLRVIGQEEIEVGTGKFLAWHVLRVPRPGSYDQKLDIWLAPQQEWYPVRLRFTETNGDYLDMSLSKLTVATPH